MRLDRGQIEVVDDQMAEVLRVKTPTERIRIGFSIWESVRNMLRVHLTTTYPEWNEERVNREVSERISHGAI